jgi:hypothetical protein
LPFKPELQLRGVGSRKRINFGKPTGSKSRRRRVIVDDEQINRRTATGAQSKSEHRIEATKKNKAIRNGNILNNFSKFLRV